MTTDSEKIINSETAVSGDADWALPNSSSWAPRAMFTALIAWFICNILIFPLLVQLEKHVTLKIIIGLLPLHVAGLGAALLVIRYSVQPGQRITVLGLQAAGLQQLRHHLLPSLVTGTAIYLGGMGITILTMNILNSLKYEPQPMPLIQTMKESASPSLMITAFIVVVLIAPIAEEILFRTVIFEGLRKFGYPIAACASASIFSIAHFSPVQIPSLLVLGLVLQYVRYRNKSLWPCVFYHMFYNLISFILLSLYLIYHI